MLKEKILQDLEENRGMPISGQELARKYDVSRNAVWKAVNSLKEEGHDIISGKNRGYYISETCDKVSAQGIRSFLPDEYKGMNIKCFDSIDSTNSEVKRQLIEGLESPFLVYAETQTGGRGRLGRSFFSPPGAGIYMSLYYKVDGGVKSPMQITMAAAVAVIRAIEKLTKVKPSVKWVNDIFIGDKKTGGILTESVMSLENGMLENVIVGIGINVKKVKLPPELKDIVTSIGDKSLNRNMFIAEIIKNLLILFSEMDVDNFMDEYIEHSNVTGKKVKYESESGSAIGIVQGIERDGSLLVKREDGIKDRVVTGEILFRE